MPGVKFRVGILAHHHTLAHTLPQFGDPVCMSVWFCLLVSGTQQPKNWGKKNSVVQEKLKSNPRKMEINSLILFYNFIVQNVWNSIESIVNFPFLFRPNVCNYREKIITWNRSFKTPFTKLFWYSVIVRVQEYNKSKNTFETIRFRNNNSIIIKIFKTYYVHIEIKIKFSTQYQYVC